MTKHNIFHMRDEHFVHLENMFFLAAADLLKVISDQGFLERLS